jgi:segregation and condensation protein A
MTDPQTEARADGLPVIARIHGQPLLEAPQDLYIPPDALEVLLETFEGPLDLLLYLIRRQNLDVLDIPMARVTRQYLDYIEVMRDNRLELAAEYLLMAALLIEIKSRMLLPRPPAATAAPEADPRAELARRLLEYERIKRAAQRLDELPQSGRDFTVVRVAFERTVERLPEVRADDLRAAWLALLQRARLTRHHRISRDQLSVREHMTRVLRRLSERGYVEFAELFDPGAGVPVLVVTLLAILELARESLIELTQQQAYAPIYLRLAGTVQ